MESHWNDEVAAGLGPLDLLVYASRLVGAETSLAVWGGGNTSLKLTEPDLRGRPIRVLRVKGSGSDLKSVSRKDWATRRWSPTWRAVSRSRDRRGRPSVATALGG